MQKLQRNPNFAAGPSKLPDPVIQRIREEMFDYQGKGFSIIEVSHRSKMFHEVYAESQALFYKLFKLPQNYRLIYLQGGAAMQFAWLPMNFMAGKKAAYVDTGVWSSKAIEEAKKQGEVVVVASSKEKGYSFIPEVPSVLPAVLAYLHITTNNTIYGTQYHKYPKTNLPLFADACSDLGSKPVDFSLFQVIYAAAQKNLGVAGLSLVIIDSATLAQERQGGARYFSYNAHAENESMLNTPNTFGIYVLKLVLEWIEQKGGLAAIDQENQKKAALLYDLIDNSQGFYHNKVEKKDRSWMNVPFFLKNDEARFLEEAEKEKLFFLKGHKTTGGLRASIYNATSLAEVETLASFMRHFQKSYG